VKSPLVAAIEVIPAVTLACALWIGFIWRSIARNGLSGAIQQLSIGAKD
jgi:hypothetical protein